MALIHLELDTARDFWSEFQSVTRGLARSATLSIIAARMRIASGRVDEVRAELPRLHRAQLDREPTTSGDLGVLCQLGLVTVALRDLERSATVYERLLPHVHLIAVDDFWFSYGSVAYFAGVLAGAIGQHEAARKHLEHALERNLKLGYRVQATWTRYHLARVLQVSQSSAEREQASALLREVDEDARRQRLRALLRQIDPSSPA
jgi:tetratricopeptide (TPR) repeat protein